MPYSTLEANQTISFNNLQSGVTEGFFTAKTAIPVSLKQITKTEANTYVNINTSLPSYSAKASNQLVTKSDLSGITSVSPYVMYGVAGTSGYRSINGGNTFTALAGLPALNWTGIAGDITGTYIAAICRTQNNQIYISTNSGTTFTAITISAILIGFYPTGVSMSANGQYVSVAGCSNSSSEGSNRSARLATSNNYGASFAAGSYTDGTGYNLYNISGKTSVSGNGQYMTAVFSYKVDPGFPNYPRPWSFRVYSSDYGATWTKSGTSEYSAFLDIALDNTGQNQFLTIDWVEPGISGTIGIKAYVSNNFGSTWTERYSNTTAYYLGGVTNNGFVSATISDNGQSMVGANNGIAYLDGQTSGLSPRVIASSNSGSTFSSTEGYNGNIGIAGGNIVVAGVTNNYVAMMLNNIGQFNYSVNGGVTFIPATSGSYPWTQIYRKALATTTTTSTTTLAPVNFSTSAGCANGSSADGTGTMVSFSGGSGVYQASDITYASEAAALAGSYTDVTSTRSFPGLVAGTYFVALRDKNNTTNKIAKPFTVTVCTTTTTTTQPPITANSSSVCTTSGQNITIDTFAGGDGTTYFASTTTYGDAGAASLGAVTEVTTVPKSRTYSNQDNGTRYIKITSGALTLIKPVGTTYNQAENWVNNGATFCSSCIAYQPQINNNPCSSTYNTTRNLSLGATAPCNYSPVWVNRDINIYWVCVGVDKYYEQINTNPCYTGTQTQTGTLYEQNSVDCGYVPPTTTTTTTVAPDCECWTVYNEGGTTGNYSYVRCSDGVTVSRNIPTGTAGQVNCIRTGTSITVNSGILTLVDCNAPCNTNPDCSPC